MWLSLPHIFLKYYIFSTGYKKITILTILNENLLVVSKFCYTFATQIKNKWFLKNKFNILKNKKEYENSNKYNGKSKCRVHNQVN